MQKKGIILGLIICTTFSMGFFKSKKDTLAKVGRTQITLTDLNKRIDGFPENLRETFNKKEYKVRILDQMIDEVVLLNKAKKIGLTRSKDYKQQIKDAKKQILISMLINQEVDKKININDEDISTYYKENQSQFEEKEQRRAKHILVKTKKEALSIHKKIRAGKNFDKLAKRYSIDPTKDNGGDLGWFTKGQLVPEFEKAVFALKRKGQVSKVVKTQYGHHIIKLTDTKVRDAISLDSIKEQIQQSLFTNKKQELTNTLLADAKKDAKIVRNNELLEIAN